MIRVLDPTAAVVEPEDLQERLQVPLRLVDGVDERSRIDEVTYLRECISALNVEIETLTRSVTHALRSPLWAVDGFARMLLEELGESADEECRRDVFNVLGGAETLTALLNELANFSKITRHPLTLSCVDLSSLAGSIMRQLQENDKEREVEFLVADGLTAYGDSYLLGLVLANLFGNAWKLTWDRRPAIIEFGADRNFRHPHVKPGQTVYFIRDNGLGFDESHGSKLFSPYQHLHASERLQGAGMGLATVRRVIHLHCGRVWATARKDEGATFYFCLGQSVPATDPIPRN